MARVLDSVTMPIKKNGTATPQEYINNPKSTAPQFSASTAYAVGQYVFYNKKLYRFKAAHAAGAWNAAHVDEVTVASELKEHGADITELKADLSECETALETKAEIDGSYDTMTVGTAKQLTSNVGINDKAPYLFRTAGGANDIGDREEDTIVGGSVVWNQYAKVSSMSWPVAGYHGIYVTKVDDETVHVSGTATANAQARAYYFPKASSLKNHVCYVKSGNSNVKAYLGNMSSNYAEQIDKPTTSPDALAFYISNGTDFGENGIDIKPKIIDLTAMLPAAIVDYIMTITPMADRVAWLKRYFMLDKDYPYSDPTFKHVEGVSAHKMTEFNQWDEQWELGTIDDSTGSDVAASNVIRAKGYIPVLPSTSYYIGNSGSVGMRVFFYDEGKNFISPYREITNTTTMTPANARYMRFRMFAAYGTTYKNDICINLHWDGERDGEYEPYKEYNYPLDSDVILRGNPKLDANNDLYYDGDTYEADGTVTRRYGIVDMGTLTYVKQSNFDDVDRYYTPSLDSLVKDYGALITPKFINKSALESWCCWVTVGNGKTYFCTPKNQYNDGSAFVTAMSGVYLLYELATPTTETADPFQSPQVVDDWGTEEYVYADGAFPIPVGHDTFYAANLKAKLEMAPDSPGDGDGDYIVRQTNGLNEYVKMVKELPSAPTTDGSYHLEVTVASGTPTLTWVADE